MVIILAGVVAGVLGTLVMDTLNFLFSRTGVISKIEIGLLGRMSAGWSKGRFLYRHPGEINPVANEKLLGYITHYSIGVGLAVVYMFGWDFLVGGPASAIWAIAYGIATTVASHFLVFPSIGLGVFGRRSPEGLKSTFSSLANHLFFGVGMAIALAVV
jgi:hypothetical protein